MNNTNETANSTFTPPKIRREHQIRSAIVYVRQSTMEQVESNLESKKRQYALVDRAQSFGWPKESIEVIDDDMGKSASKKEGRYGFARLVAKVGMGEVGIILGLEVSRLARNSRDWYQLLDLCAVFDTLIADSDGIYNPRSFNDRLLLGLKGTMSEAELHLLRNRLNAGLENKAKRGELILGLPVGFCLSEDGEIEKDPNELVQHTINIMFDKFRITGSAYAAFRDIQDENILFPYRKDVMGRKGVEWRQVTYRAIYNILKNPIYAGAYSFGRTATIQKPTEDGNIHKYRGSTQEMSHWMVLITEHHQGYITWVEYEENQKRIDSNCRGFGKLGPVKGGISLLSGLVRCEICGRSMLAGYTGTNSNCPRYTCPGKKLTDARDKCQSFGSQRLEERISSLVLSVLEPQALEAALIALNDFENERKQQIHRLDLEIERAIHTEELARRRFENIEPENRLVARVLEKKWEDSLAALKEGKQIRDRKISSLPPPLSDIEKKELKKVLEELPKLWTFPTTTPNDQKEIVRLLIHHITTRADHQNHRLYYSIHWVTGHISKGDVKLNKTGEHRWTTSDTALEMIQKLAVDHSDAEIAMQMTRAGKKTPHGLLWSEFRVRSIRMYHKIMKPTHRPEDLIGCKETRQILGICYEKFRELINQGKLKGEQVYPNSRWRISKKEVEQLAFERRRQS